jgi:CRISPR-associated protein Cas6
MFWQEDKQQDPAFVVPDDILDLTFKIKCSTLPLEHAHALSAAIHAAMPWFSDEEQCGLHLIHGAESGNGWMRPEDPDNELLHLSRRTRLVLRLPKQRIADAQALVGQVMDVDGHRLEIGEAAEKRFIHNAVMFSRYVITDTEDENAFLEYVAAELANLDVGVRKLMGGKLHQLRFPDGPILTRSVMVADLEPEESVRLQQQGIGPGRHYGCGLFLPHKGIKAVQGTQDEG